MYVAGTPKIDKLPAAITDEQIVEILVMSSAKLVPLEAFLVCIIFAIPLSRSFHTNP